MIDDVLFKLEGDDFEGWFESRQRSTLLVQSLVDERLNGVKHWHKLFATVSRLSQYESYDHEPSILV